MIVCYFGPYNPTLARNRVIVKGLARNGVEVIKCGAYSSNCAVNYLKILRKHFRVDHDVVMLGARGSYYGQPLVPLVKSISRKPLIFDAMLTLYGTDIVDRGLVKRESIKAKLWYLLDYVALHGVDLILSDTRTHAEYFSGAYNVRLKKFRKVFVGSDDDIFFPRQFSKEDDYFLVMFWGSFIPLQGVKYIIRAAKLLENYKDVKFELRGFGQTYNNDLELSRNLRVKNIIFNSNWIPFDELPNYIARADICLGIFGETEKAKRVIPHKAFEALAMRKPLITGDSLATREILANMENCLLVPMADPKAIADAIVMLKEDKKLRDKIAENGYRLFKEKLSPKVIGKELKSILMELVQKQN